MNKLLILSRDADRYTQLLLESCLKQIQIYHAVNLKSAEAYFDIVNIVLGDPDLIKSALPFLNNVKWVQSTWAGIRSLVGTECRKDYLLTGVKDVFGPIMSEYVVCYMLMNERNAIQRFASQKNKIWDTSNPGLLRKKTIGIMGTGSIGGSIARAAKFFQMKTKGYSRTRTSCEFVDEWYTQNDTLLDFVGDLDYLVSTLPDTQATSNLLDKTVFKAMKPNAILINVGRGNILDETDLIEAVTQGYISGAVLDVFEQEPLPAYHPFWTTPGILITSHTAAISYPEDIAPIFIQNYHLFQSEKPLKYLIDFNRGY